jgi:hypothetical protein
MKIPPCFLAGIVSTSLLAGCQTRTASFQAHETTKYSIENTEKFARLDMATQAAIICTGLQERLTAEGRLEVVANVKNRTNNSMQVRVKCVFKDTNGFATGDETVWQLITLGDDATEAVRFAASNKLAHKYTVVVRSP